MKWITLPLLMLIHFSVSSQQPWRKGEMQVRVYPASAEDYAMIRQFGLNADECDGFLRCYLTPGELSRIESRGIATQTEIADLNLWAGAFGPRGVPSGYYTVSELNEIADSLALHFPGICTLHELGTGSGFYPLRALKISDNSSVDENEAEIMFDGGIHGDEVGGPENMIRFARDLCLGYGTDEQITGLVDNREIWIYYCVNPYGRENMTRYNANGVDINRDCGYMWNAEGNSTSANSQPETRVYRNLMFENQFVIHCSYHSGTEYISYPWSYRGDPTPDDAFHDFLASEYAANSGYPDIPYGQGFTGMYAINGSTKDLGYGALGAISWSVEISLSKQPPASQIGAYYLKNKAAMLSMIDYAGYGIEGLVSDSATGLPLPANIYIEDFYPVESDPVTGDFHKFLLPGFYTVRVEANGYESRVFSQVMIPESGSAVLNVSMTPAPGTYAKRLVACQIPNNNFNDEGYTPAATGSPDNIRYSLGRMGYAVLDMGTDIPDGEGNEFVVHENDNTPEGFMLYAGQTMDGPWGLLGNGNGNSAFDLATAGMSSARYLKIKDDGDGQSQVADAGFDLDAIEGLMHFNPVDSTGFVEGIVYALTTQSPVMGATVTCGAYMTISDENGYFLIQADTGHVEICAEIPGYIYGCDSIQVLPGDTLASNIHVALIDGTKIKHGYNQGLSAYPNPCDDFLMLGLKAETPQKYNRYELFNGNGMRVSTGPFDNSGTRISTVEFPPGIYLMKVSGHNGYVSEKILIR